MVFRIDFFLLLAVITLLALLALLAVARWRRAPWRSVARAAALLAFVPYSIVVFSMTLATLHPVLSSGPPDWPRLLPALVPFHDLAEILSDPSLTPARLFWNVGGNVLLFVPLGFLLPALRPVSWPRLLLAGLLASASIEGLQLLQYILLGEDHVVSSDDVLLNVIGASVGYAGFLAVRYAVETLSSRRSERRLPG